MHFLLRLLIAVSCVWLSSCSLTPDDLKQAEKIMETNPDSALRILEKVESYQTLTDANRALYGLLYYEATEKNSTIVKPDSLIDFALDYYKKKNNKLCLCKCYLYKARTLKSKQRYDDATILYLKALDISESKHNYFLSGKIHLDMGDMCAIQGDFNESLNKYQKSMVFFKKSDSPLEIGYASVALGRIYRFLKKNDKAEQYYQQALKQSADSFLHGIVYQEIGINYYQDKKNDSAEFYLRKSLTFPYRGTNYAIRCFTLADLLFDQEQYDSAKHYAKTALKHPSSFFNQRDCYRILANSEYSLGNFKDMAIYMTKYQDCTDSVRKVEKQTKTTVLENLHNTKQEAQGTKRSMAYTLNIVFFICIFSGAIVYILYRRNKQRKQQLSIVQQQLEKKQVFLHENISTKIKETKALQSDARKNADSAERLKLDKELYEKCLHLSNWEAFSCEMNHAFNDIVLSLQKENSQITQREIIWCCLHLLDIPHPDRTILLNATSDSLYKLKQRLAQKLNLGSAKELDSFLNKFIVS